MFEVLTFNLRLCMPLTHSQEGSHSHSSQSKLAIREMRGKRGASCLDGAKEELRPTCQDILRRCCVNHNGFIQWLAGLQNAHDFYSRSRPLTRCARSAVLRGSKCNGSGRTSSERSEQALQRFPLFANPHRSPQPATTAPTTVAVGF